MEVAGRGCDGPLPSSPSGNATGADSAASNPEKDRAFPNPVALPGRRRQKREVHGTKRVEKAEEPADGDDNAEETETEEETLRLEQAVKEYSLGCWESADQTCLESPEETAAREAFCDSPSHASGEALPSQVRGN
ncbi:hypothetical protein NDU88_004128 [Pleurodeles waltl]|uniref:Uncharacterized protein n=1 Tax=Pleurodeles waltl TaxID=8319 RepID=A0AAV7W439_PLEWA|nr:hypothetical protein NDU88_004128 [Pleurodeles waltl]